MGHGALHTLLSYLYCSSTGGCHTSESLCGPAGTPVAIPGSSQASVTLNGTNLDISMAGQSSSLAVPAGAQVSQCLPAKAICRLVAHVGQLAICSSHNSQQVSPSFAESGCALGAHRYLLLPVSDQTDSSPNRLGCIQAHQQSAGVTSAYAWHILRGSSLQSLKPLLQQMGTPSHLMTHPAGGGPLVRCDATAGSRFLSEKVKTFLSLQMEGTPPAAEPFQQSARYKFSASLLPLQVAVLSAPCSVLQHSLSACALCIPAGGQPASPAPTAHLALVPCSIPQHSLPPPCRWRPASPTPCMSSMSRQPRTSCSRSCSTALPAAWA